MGNQEEQVFSFYLNESLQFKGGQGVRELLGISLEPEITLEDLGEEVRLKGTVILAGEYMPGQEEDKYADTAPIQSGRIVDLVERGEEGVYEFSHSFPVEVTIPADRVDDADHVHINIESFDYEIPAEHHLRLEAQLNINGLRQEQDSPAPEQEVFDESLTVGPVDFNHEEPERPDTPIFDLQEHRKLQELEQPEDINEQEEEEGRWSYKKSQSLSDYFKESKIEHIQEISSESTSEWEGTTNHVNASETPPHSTLASYQEGEENENGEEASPSAGVNGIKQIFKHLFPNREDSYTKMKMYIAQDNETVEMIAERYEVPVKQIEKINNLEEDVSPGQIVYIPH
ncbi:stage VI sporulation protein D [Halobacillus ihumii]|uniref:stage VI sporulation protein D n=1 Tax=Halobacillus ihumii TaxID=2686092 RepID=UPI0013D3D927|nr:stage VI sporulation protein D [Halobacillus ihumii]